MLEARTRAILTLRSRSGLNTDALGALKAYELATLGPNPVAAESAIRFAARILLSPYSDAIFNALGLDDRTNRHLTLTARRNESWLESVQSVQAPCAVANTSGPGTSPAWSDPYSALKTWATSPSTCPDTPTQNVLSSNGSNISKRP